MADNNEFAAENDQLLQDEKSQPNDDQPKRNSKGELIKRIIDIAEKNEIELEYSDTKLKRMTKQQLMEVMGELMEKAMRSQMAQQMGCDKNASEQVIALGALRMIHDIAANSFEKGANLFVDQYGWEIDGFTKTLKEPVVSDCVDQCLQEIAAENQDLLNYVKSPYARLGLAWAGALTACVKRKHKVMLPKNKRNASSLGTRPVAQKNPDERRASGRPANGQVVRSV